MNTLTHGGPEDFARALGAATGSRMADIKVVLQGINASEAAESAHKMKRALQRRKARFI